MAIQRLHNADEVASALGDVVSAWWLKSEARAKRIPAVKIAGAWAWTDAMVAEIVAMHSHAVVTPRQETTLVRCAPQVSGEAGIAPLRARPPRRLRSTA